MKDGDWMAILDRDQILLIELEAERKVDSAKKNIILTLLGIGLCAILLPLLICNILLIIQGYQNPNEVPGVAGYKPMLVLTDSMSPTIKSGDLIIIKEINPNELKIGDIITFFDPAGNNQTTVTHTIKNIYKEDGVLMFETQGDNNNKPDRLLVNADAVIGIYTFRIPVVANIIIFMQTVPGLILCVFVPLGALIIYDFIKRLIYEKRNDYEREALMAELAALRAERK